MSFNSNSVSEWVDYIQTLHVREIELSLERVREVAQALSTDDIPFKVVSVAGTNGKGSTSEMISSIFNAAGYRAGKFSSPHLVRFNERFDVCGIDVTDEELISAFRAVELARTDVPITYFEYGFLLAIALFIAQKIDIAVMEVGLGGRLDAVNVLDSDVAVITSIALDHTAWLGDTLEEIAYEKVGIARSEKPCVVGVLEPQNSIIRHLESIKARRIQIGRDFDFLQSGSHTWCYRSGDASISDIPLPFGQSGVQLTNAALAIKSVSLLSGEFPVEQKHVKEGLANAQLAGRCQLVSTEPAIVLDVSHNEASMARLAEFIVSLNIKGRVVAVCGMLRDKEITASLAQIKFLVSHWHVGSINEERGSSAAHIKACIEQTADVLSSDSVNLYDNCIEAYENALKTLTIDDCLVVFGSFYVVGDIIGSLEET